MNMKLAKGDEIITSKPFVYLIMSNLRGERCDNCLQANPALKKCMKCNFVYYCNKECQREAWPDHKAECRSLIRIKSKKPPDFVMLLARIIRKLRSGGDQESEKIGNLVRAFYDLESHKGEIREDKSRNEAVTTAYVVLSQFLNREELPTLEEVFELAGKIIINAITISSQLTPVAVGIYLGVSALNHSCHPNVSAVFDGPSIRLVSLQNFPEFEVSKLFINYIDIIDRTAVRRKCLEEQYYFRCDCATCLDDHLDALKTSLKCPNSHCSNAVIPNIEREEEEEPCSACATSVSVQRFRDANVIVKKLEKNIEMVKSLDKTNLKRSSLSQLETTLTEAKLYLHPLNVTYIQGLDEIFDAFINLGDFKNALKYGRSLMEGYRKYYGVDHIKFALLLAKIGKIELFLDLLPEAEVALDEASRSLRFLCGVNHPLYREAYEMYFNVKFQNELGNNKI